MLNFTKPAWIVLLVIPMAIFAACQAALPSPTPLLDSPVVKPTTQPTLTIELQPTVTLTPVPAMEATPTLALPTLITTLPGLTPIPLDNSLRDLPAIEPENAIRLGLRVQLPGTTVFSPDSATLGVIMEDGIYLYETDSLGVIEFLPCEGESQCEFDFAPDGSLLAWNPDDSMVRIWNVSQGTKTSELSEIAKPCCRQITFSPDGSYLAFIDGSSIGNLWEIGAEQEILSLGRIQALYFSPDSNTLAAESADDLSVTLWDIESQRESQTLTGFTTAAPVYRVQFSPDWRYMLWETGRPNAQIMDVVTGQLGNSLEITQAKFSPDSRILAGTEQGWGPFECTGQLCLFTLPSGELLSKIEHDDMIWSLEFSPNGRILTTYSQDRVRLWDLESASEVVSLNPQTEEGVWKLVFSPDGRLLAIHIRGGSTQLWGVAP